LIYLDLDPAKLTANARREILDPANELYFSVASLWEMQLKIARGKLILSRCRGAIKPGRFVALKAGQVCEAPCQRARRCEAGTSGTGYGSAGEQPERCLAQRLILAKRPRVARECGAGFLV